MNLKKIVLLVLICACMLSLVSCGEKDIQFNELSDLSGKSITFEMGSIHAQYIMENSKGYAEELLNFLSWR